MSVLVEIVHADGSSRSHRCDGDRIVIGSSREADVRVEGAPEIAPLQLLVIPRAGGTWVSNARDASVRPTIRGTELQNDVVPWNTEIDVGSITVTLQRAAAGSRRSALAGSRGLVILAATAVATLAMLMTGEGQGMPPQSAPAPALFADGVTACPEPERAAARAAEAARAADAKEARYVYEAREGVEAVVLLDVARECFALAGLGERAAAATHAREALAARVEGDFKARQLLLDRAREAGDLERLSAHIQAVRPYVLHRPGPYLDWLVRLERYVEMKLEASSKRRKPSL